MAATPETVFPARLKDADVEALAEALRVVIPGRYWPNPSPHSRFSDARLLIAEYLKRRSDGSQD